MDATYRLREEHRLIQRVLECLEIALRRAILAGRAARTDFDPLVGFFREFADAYHHGMEEDALFAHLSKMGILEEGDPIAQMIREHECNRSLLSGIERHLESADAGDTDAVAAVIEHGWSYIDAQRSHIDKEEHCLFGMAELAIQGDERTALLRTYSELEADPVYSAAYERHLKVADRLIARYGLPALPIAAPPQAVPPEDLCPSAAERTHVSPPGPARKPSWREYSTQIAPDTNSELAVRVERALASLPVALQREALQRCGLDVDPEPLLWKELPGSQLRLFFPVRGGSERIEEGDVVCLVLLYDILRERTLYAHPIHAGPGANPLLKHLGGPMAQPKAQPGEKGDRATRRLLENKTAIWRCFLREQEEFGPEEAGRRWRQRYAWTLIRLYFCERCSACRWGSPFFEGSDGAPHRTSDATAVRPEPARMAGWEAARDAIRRSDAWSVEVQYARRGGFTISEEPQLVWPLDGDHLLAVFPSDAEFLDGGCIVGMAVYFHAPSSEVRYLHCLSAGPDPETLFLHGDRALAFPQPGAGREGAREAYVQWRAEAWWQFWLDELDLGIHAASRNWLHSFWEALTKLLGTFATER